jgi:uncharacterized delta-60 repeat protein
MLLSCLLLGLSFVSAAFAVTEEWVARYDGSGNGLDEAWAIAVDSSGNVYVTGYSWGSGSGADYATVKYNSTGAEQWASRYNGSGNGNDYAWAIAVDSSGNVYVTGWSWGSGTLSDYATVKYNSAGAEQWVATYDNASGDDEAHSIAVDSSGNVYVTGASEGSGGNVNYATIKYNSGGVQQWVARYNNSSSGDGAYAIAVDSSGNVYVTGYSVDPVTGADYATIKYNSAGVQQWVARYNGPGNSSDTTNAIAVDSSGNVYVTGPSIGSGTGQDYATIKYNSAGAEQWVARYNGPGNGQDYAYSLAVDSLGNVYVAGHSYNTTNDYAIVKYNSAGAEQWVARYDNGSNDYAYSLALDSSGNVYVAGESEGPGTSSDYVTIKYDSTGAEQWVARYNGPGNDYDYAESIVLDSSGNAYVTGASTGSGTDEDYATIKYAAPLLPAGGVVGGVGQVPESPFTVAAIFGLAVMVLVTLIAWKGNN